VLKIAPITVPSESARKPLLTSSASTLRPVMAPSARNMPVASMKTIITTRHMVRLGMRKNCGTPNCSGMTTRTIGSSAMPLKSVQPSAMVTRYPTVMPISTATFCRNPRVNLITKRMIASTSAATAR
jgi:hypothetical protein